MRCSRLISPKSLRLRNWWLNLKAPVTKDSSLKTTTWSAVLELTHPTRASETPNKVSLASNHAQLSCPLLPKSACLVDFPEIGLQKDAPQETNNQLQVKPLNQHLTVERWYLTRSKLAKNGKETSPLIFPVSHLQPHQVKHLVGGRSDKVTLVVAAKPLVSIATISAASSAT